MKQLQFCQGCKPMLLLIVGSTILRWVFSTLNNDVVELQAMSMKVILYLPWGVDLELVIN
ncbi:hypothetical protein PPL_05984 [Heterostelium album PN500]|uniref:Uncharacterized protein n=1 Tax=Heterostelium pallidum (strain ATCC 26659 / Pp 5 / PN500) TaxID=670386 RepID=D3BBW4_HETP5|nr:hypothetical protein PPL_05984 [Heterostelium album PN500]EFA81147.1 hypothetical protein PPL_05984 [Heterostelium album PN500]|eukprot:XP_020433265.1 hypothetical protein PPL_05984 [Heterostelium album PN500]